jgi:nucleoside-diphosphate-sugar epimerase
MVVAVTGASGIVGSAIVDKLASEKFDVRKVVRPDVDILDMAGLVKAFDGVDAVVHAAGFVSFNPRNKRKLFDINVQGTRNVVNACLANGAKKIVHISSVAALGRHRNSVSINEDTRWVQGMPVSDYAHSKYLSELEVYRGMEEGLQVSLVNPSVVLAAGDGKRSSSQLFGYVWHEQKFYTDFDLNYVDARDVSEIVVRLLRGGHNGEKFIASSGSVPIKKVFQEIAQRFQKRAPSINVPPGLASTVAVLEEFRAALTGAEPTISRQSVLSLREGLIFENAKAKRVLGMEFQSLEKTLDWCCNEYRAVNINK